MKTKEEMSEKEQQVFMDGQNLAKSFCDAVNPMGYGQLHNHQLTIFSAI